MVPHKPAGEASQALPPNQQALADALNGSDAARRAEQRRQQETPISKQESAPAVGRIRFELQDGTRVAKFFDTKDVLIYQVPPKGHILLLTAVEPPIQGQVETSA